MDKYIKDNAFLARWIAGELTPDELEKFKKSNDYPVLKKINEASQSLKAPTFNEQALLSKIKERNNLKRRSKGNVIRLVPNWVYAAAAVLVAFGIFYIMSAQAHFKTGFSEQLAVVLPDQSEVMLNANTKMDYKTFNWKSNREITLDGEAFFDVEKGESFKVVTDEGFVEVLGTEFNVIARDSYFEVQCMEGKVRVTSSMHNKNIILLPGKAVRIFNNTMEDWDFALTDSNWTIGESTFVNTPIEQVLLALENQFEIKFDRSNINTNKRFTGAFTHENLKLALRTVAAPMGITYSVNKEKNVIILNSN